MMKTLAFIFILLPLISIGQTKRGNIKLTDTVSIDWTITDFSRTEHKISYCNDGQQRYLCKIDDKEWYGSDRSEAVPKNQLTKLSLKIGNRTYNLQTSKMFNPNYSGQLYQHQFKIKKFNRFHRLYGFFSDGGGTYTVYWKILDSTAIRELISVRDEDFQWQLND